MKRGFSLVELSIVIVIIGLVVGGIISGKSVIRSAQMRSVMADAGAYAAAYNSFRDQYRYLPGDMPTAETYWQSSVTDNGNADSVVSGAERFLFWQHLNLAGLAEVKYTGLQGAGGSEDFVLGSNTPASRVALTGFGFYYDNVAGGTTTYELSMGNVLTFGMGGSSNSGPPTNAAFTASEALTIDNKADDGKPGTGKWIANGTGGGVWSAADACTTSTSNTDFAGDYNVYSATTSCSFFIQSGF